MVKIATRRTLLKMLSFGTVGLLAAARLPRALAAATGLVPLTSADPTAKALGYSDDTTKVDQAAHPSHTPEQKCSTCVQYQGKPGDARGGCNIYAGKSVSANGWCSVWAKKAG
jgi:hypothetical protein